MKVDIKPSPLRWFLFAINIIFFLLGFAMVAAGMAVKVKGDFINGPLVDLLRDLNTQQDGATIEDMLVTLSNLFIAVGLAGLVVSLIGCSGAACSWRSCLIAYGIDVIIVMVLAVVAGVLAWFLGSGELAYLENSMKENLKRHYKGNEATDSRSVAWNYIFHSVNEDNSNFLTVCTMYYTGTDDELSKKLKNYSATLFVLGGIYTLVMLCCACSSILLFIIMGRQTHEEIDPGGCTET
ncbi:CD82 antigen-like [Argopecten irradians]|uniref:CD82 antigen-like n=1 Tax=Argopecten irradians TaxID=31199 RepID=UPI0037243010